VKADIVADSVDTLANAMKGSYGAFLVTNFWDPASMGKEAELGHKLVDAAQKAGVKHITWASLANVEKLSNVKYLVPHFTDKAKVEEYIRSLQAKKPRAFESVTFPAAAFYYQNFKLFFPPKQEGDTLVFTLPATEYLTAFDVNEVGPAVLTAFNNPREYDGVRIDYWGEHAHPQQYIDTFAKVTGHKARLVSVPLDKFAKLGFPGAEEMANMFGWFNEFTYYGPGSNRKVAQAATPGGLTSWEQFLRKYGWQFTAA